MAESDTLQVISIYRMIIYQFKQCINFHAACVIYEWCGIAYIYQCRSDMCGVIIYSVTQIYVLKGYKTAPQPSHPISQLITVSSIYCVCVVRESMIKGMCYPSYPEEMF